MPSSSTPAVPASASQAVSLRCSAAISRSPATSGTATMNVPSPGRPAAIPRSSSSRYAFITVSGLTASDRVTSLIRGSRSPTARNPSRSA